MNEVTAGPGKNFLDVTGENPCAGCSAPCCRLLLIPHATPTSFMDLDYIRYMVGFQGVEMILTRDGQWRIVIEQTCRLLDRESCRCTVHNTPRKPKTCVFFNPYNCWYKRNFHKADDPPDVVRISAEGLEAVLTQVRFDEDGRISETPSWDLVRELIRSGKGTKPGGAAAQS